MRLQGWTVFPLTPALSPSDGEREKIFLVFGYYKHAGPTGLRTGGARALS